MFRSADGVSHSDDARQSGIDRPLARRLAEVTGALSTPSRLLILGELREHARSVGDLAAAVGMEPSAVSQLRILPHLGFVVGTRNGRQVIYALHDPHVAVLLDEAIFHVEHLRLDHRTTHDEVGA